MAKEPPEWNVLEVGGIGAPSEIAPLIPAHNLSSFSGGGRRHRRHQLGGGGVTQLFAIKPNNHLGRKDEHHSSSTSVILSGEQHWSLQHRAVWGGIQPGNSRT